LLEGTKKSTKIESTTADPVTLKTQEQWGGREGRDRNGTRYRAAQVAEGGRRALITLRPPRRKEKRKEKGEKEELRNMKSLISIWLYI